MSPLCSSSHQAHCHWRSRPTLLQPQFTSHSLPSPPEWPSLLWVAVEGPQGQGQTAAPTVAVTRPISVFVFAQLSPLFMLLPSPSTLSSFLVLPPLSLFPSSTFLHLCILSFAPVFLLPLLFQTVFARDFSFVPAPPSPSLSVLLPGSISVSVSPCFTLHPFSCDCQSLSSVLSVSPPTSSLLPFPGLVSLNPLPRSLLCPCLSVSVCLSLLSLSHFSVPPPPAISVSLDSLYACLSLSAPTLCCLPVIAYSWEKCE